MRTPGVESGSQAWKACMIPAHYVTISRQVRLTMRDAQPRGQRNPTGANPSKLRRQRATAAKQLPRQPSTTTKPNHRHPRKSVCVTHLAVWSSGMIPASGAGGPGSNSRSSPIFPTHKYRHARTCKPTPVGSEPKQGDPKQADALTTRRKCHWRAPPGQPSAYQSPQTRQARTKGCVMSFVGLFPRQARSGALQSICGMQ